MSIDILNLEGSPLKRNALIDESENLEYLNALAAQLREVFVRAREKSELQYAFALMPENRNIQNQDWSRITETFRSIEEFLQFAQEGEMTPFKARTSFAFYAHLGSADAFYEVPMNMLRIAAGGNYDLWPLGWAATIERNETSIIAALREAAVKLGMNELASLFDRLYDFDIVQAYLHGDYVLWNDGIHLGRRHLADPQLMPWDNFNAALNRALGFFQIVRQLIGEGLLHYREGRTIVAIHQGVERSWQIKYDAEQEFFTIRTEQHDADGNP